MDMAVGKSIASSYVVVNHIYGYTQGIHGYT